jgi:hypothetical protein
MLPQPKSKTSSYIIFLFSTALWVSVVSFGIMGMESKQIDTKEVATKVSRSVNKTLTAATTVSATQTNQTR